MSIPRDELLRPSLQGMAAAKAPYSVQTMFVTSFFGGPFAAIAIIGVNSVRLQRLGRDAVPLGLMLGLSILIMAAPQLTAWGREAALHLVNLTGPRALSYVSRIAALIFFGIGYAMHRSEQRSADFMDLARPNGWIGGLACFAAGLAAAFAFGFLIALARGQ